ncbi:gentamicin 3'-N-acetyltransferase [Methylorubrum populi]|uniref:Gentamicin 3'-N-acetyltransferase n=1 Tax=Methylorubrum populi TaxID=223967 RepID=A0A160PIV6_9HYPH|nr:AAC(3)-I family aminoglycoside N-acetyltransferase [Methylorubrum populi]BAU92904.1 gentamicin 3'-N-acetyltransferase [Methylorubrum populi]
MTSTDGSAPGFAVRRLGPGDIPSMRALNALFGRAFAEPDTCGAAPPDDAYLADLLAKAHVAVLVAERDGAVLGGLVAYEFDKFERARREIYLYDLAVAAEHRRRGIATALIRQLQAHAARRGAWVVFVQGDPSDGPALALYDRLGTGEDVLHFDLPVGDLPLP